MPALLELTPYALALLCLGLALLALAIVKALFGPLGGLPLVGGAIRSAENTIVQALTDALGLAFQATDALMGGTLHHLARLWDWLWNELKANASFLAGIAPLIALIVKEAQGISSLVHRLTRTNTHSDARLKAVTKELGRLERREKALERDLARGIGEDVLPRIRALDREIAKIRTQTIPAIEAADAQAESAISNLYEWAKGKASLLGVGTFAYAVAAAIGLDALRALRCPSFLSSFTNRGCGLWNGLESLLGWVVDLFFITNLCDLIGPLEEAFSVVAAPAIGELTAAIDAMPCVAGNQPPALPVPSLSLTANPGVSLSLP